MKKLKDNFSIQAGVYRHFRPDYPESLYKEVFDQVKNFDRCWDCATGNGQVASVLASHFKDVYASEISQNQLNEAIQKPNIHYSIQRAEEIGFPEKSFDLVTVGQALHWFDFEPFFKEIKRTLKPDGILAVWGYGMFKSNEEVDRLVHHFYKNIVGPYWDEERIHIEQQYNSIQIPDFLSESLHSDHHETLVHWDAPDILSYLSSWSSVQHFIRKEGTNPVELVAKELTRLIRGKIAIRFPLFLRVYTLKT